MANDYKFSLYDSVEGRSASDVSIDNYIGMIEHGTFQDVVLKGRVLKKSGTKQEYQKFKSDNSKVITGSAIFETGASKHAANIKALNGLIVIDIDVEVTQEKYYELKNDNYTFVIHRSFGGDGYCIFVKIDSNRFEDSFDGLAEYYYNTFNILIDQSCKNKNRLRFLSYDPDIYINEKSNKFIAKNVKKFVEPKKELTNYIFHEDDFDNIFKQITERSIDLCQEEYIRYVRIGMSIADKFGFSGEDKFHAICQYGGKYNEKNTTRDYNGFCKNSQGKVGIGTFYYYCKEAGIEIYTPKTKTIINRVKVAKSQGNPTIDSIVSNLKTSNDIIASDADKLLIADLIASKQDFSKEANDELSEIEQVQKFILETYEPYYDEINNYIYINSVVMEDKELNDIYLNVKKSFDFNTPLNDIVAILYSNIIPKRNKLREFLKSNEGTPNGLIEQYANFIHPRCEYNVWAFRKWLVGSIHNWVSDNKEKLVSPLTLVLTGQQHGTGKTSFFRNILPDELNEYMVQEKINSRDKDSVYRMCKALIIFDDEFGGDGFKDVKAFKSISDINMVTQRRPFARQDSLFKRIASICGSSNEEDILRDVTGNRRILPINVTSIDYYDMLKINKTELIIEAYNLYKSGFDWIIRTQKDIDYIKENTSQNETIIPIEEIFWNHFSLKQCNTFIEEVVLNQGELLEYMNFVTILKPTKYDLKEVLTKNRLIYQNYRIDGIQRKGIKLYRKMNANR